MGPRTRKATPTHPLLASAEPDFIDDDALLCLLNAERPENSELEAVISKSEALEPLNEREAAVLLRADDPEQIERICAAASALKQRVYGNRIVLFAPLYVTNRCVNDCQYCAFRRSNRDMPRHTLSNGEIQEQVQALLDHGHKRLIVVFGEARNIDAEFMAERIGAAYASRGRSDTSIRRINVNAAPLDTAGFKRLHEVGIGTYQIFMETYHHSTYARAHPSGTFKSDYRWRLNALSRAMEAGCDDVGIGALFGLYDWRFEVLGLVCHANHLKARYGVGPHTISFPRLRPADGADLCDQRLVSDGEFARLIAILRLATPYTGLILTAREPASLRRQLLAYGVSQIDGGSRIDLCGYTRDGRKPSQEQFHLGDTRSLDEVLGELLRDGYLPSFCTACYRLGRTGEHFMEYAIPGFIRDFCTPNALTTLQEYLTDYASESTREAGESRIAAELAALPDDALRGKVSQSLARIARFGARDIYF